MKIDDKEIKKHLKMLEKEFPKKLKKVIRRHENNMAFETKKNARKTLPKQMNFKKKSSENFLNRGIYVEKSKGGGASVGSLIYDNNRKNYARYMLERMYWGENLKQAGNSGKFRKQVYIGKKKLTKAIMKNSIHLPKKIKKNDKRIRMAIGIKMARIKQKKNLFLNNDVYRVNKRNATHFMSIKKSKQVKTKKINWITKPVEMTLKDVDKIFIDAMNHELNK